MITMSINGHALWAGLKKTMSGSLWVLVLVPILGVSAYSLYFIARYFGVPPEIAVCMSTCFDGAALVAADYSVKYVQDNMSGSMPRMVVRLLAGVSAFLQAFHARIGHELPGAWLMWASLPIIAMLIYEIHLRWERRKALSRGGFAYPAPLPAFGAMAWVLFPWQTLKDMRKIVDQRKRALVAVFAKANEIEAVRVKIPKVKDLVVNETPNDKPNDNDSQEEEVTEVRDIDTQRRKHPPGVNGHAPTKHIRTWAKLQPKYRGKIGDRARLPQEVIDDYNSAVGDDLCLPA
jgi:hypothetical protein